MSGQADSGSFRDRRGRVFHEDGRVYRIVTASGAADFEFVRSTDLLTTLQEHGQYIGEARINSADGVSGDAAYVLEHPRLPFISYPYEWTFNALKSAALLHLDVHLAALERGITLSDASAYNVQFVGAEPTFIDALSFERYIEGSYWAGHQQFCCQFLNPLLLQAKLGIPHNAWYRGTLEGIPTEELNQLLPWHKKLSWKMFTHVALQARFQKSARQSDAALQKAESRKLPLLGYQEILRGLRSWISKLEPRNAESTDWADYASTNSYQDDEETRKRRYVQEFVSTTKPRLLFDLGCNTGDYSVAALDAEAQYVVGFDFDRNAVDSAFERSASKELNFLPLILDAVNPSPAQGWRQLERPGFSERANADALLALALLHHLVIAKNIPMDQAVEWLVGLAPTGVIEFVQKTDPMVKALLRLRSDIFDDYSQEAFEAILQRNARIVKSSEVSTSGRRLYSYDRG